MKKKALLSVPEIEQSIHTIRNHRVMLDSDLAMIYGVTVKRLNEQVKRNRDRFPPDFMFQLTNQDVTNLRSQIATSRSSWGGRRTFPFAFTEHGAIMLRIICFFSVLVSLTACGTVRIATYKDPKAPNRAYNKVMIAVFADFQTREAFENYAVKTMKQGVLEAYGDQPE